MPNEALIRLSVFLGLFVVFAALEALAPRRARVQQRGGRWITNIGFTVLNTLAGGGLSSVGRSATIWPGPGGLRWHWPCCCWILRSGRNI